jgi:hypothetical protein
MTRSAKLGITSVVLLFIALVPPFLNWRYPITFVSVGLSGLFGLLAAQQGSRWWLAVPVSSSARSHWRSILASIRSDDE